MIRAAIELGGTAIIMGGVGMGLIYFYYYWRHSLRKLKQEDSADEKATGIHV